MVGKAQSAHHLSESVGVNGGHASLCPPYEFLAMTNERIYRCQPQMAPEVHGQVWMRVSRACASSGLP
jgi:hypothetical protein